MRITSLAIQNYKSLRGVRFTPRQLNVVVGPNASGKSNLADAIDFIAEVYRHGLEVAITRKGGYENIAFRRMRRSKGAIEIELCVELDQSDLRRGHFGFSEDDEKIRLEIRHAFSIGTRGESIRAEFKVVSEKLAITELRPDERVTLVSAARTNGTVSLEGEAVSGGEDAARSASRRARVRVRNRRSLDYLLDFEDLRYFAGRERLLAPTELFALSVGRVSPALDLVARSIGQIRVFQLSANKAREFGVPTPEAELDRYGSNLPAVIDLMKKSSPSAWKGVMRVMRSILPSLQSIDVDYTSSRTLGLFFLEDGFGRSWSAGEVSDGTIQTLALVVAIFDPRSTALVIEEPENSVHPWIARHIIDACREVASERQVIVTTHSPIVMNAVKPEEVWVMWRERGSSHITALVDLDPGFLELWQQGEVPTFEYVDSGALPKALPPAPTAVAGRSETEG